MLFFRSRIQPAALASALFLTTTVFGQQKPAPARPAAPQTRPPARPSTAKPAPAPAPKPPPEPPDVVIKTAYTAADKTTTTSTGSAKGNRQRIEYGGQMN